MSSADVQSCSNLIEGCPRFGTGGQATRGTRRFESAAAIDAAIAAWQSDRNKLRRGTDWRFTTADARIKLKSLYPKHDVLP
jgi:hypothetical protein